MTYFARAPLRFDLKEALAKLTACSDRRMFLEANPAETLDSLSAGAVVRAHSSMCRSQGSHLEANMQRTQ
jgi:hypothetical protein